MQESTKEIIRNSGVDPDDTSLMEIEEVSRLTKDLKTRFIEVPTISSDEVKVMVKLYYQIQEMRIKLSEQIRSIEKGYSGLGESSPNLDVLNWALSNQACTEKGIFKILDLATDKDPVGVWLKQIMGIGPVISAGLMSYLDIEKTQYASGFISYAGLNDNNRPWLGREKATKIINEILEANHPEEKRIVISDEDVEDIAVATQWKYSYLLNKAYDSDKAKWDKAALIKAASMMPYNSDLKILMWKVGKSFEKLKNNPDSLYGRLLTERIVLEKSKNDKGEYKPLIEEHLSAKNYSKQTETYKSYMEGRLPDAEINARCRRWTEKIFLSHVFEEMYRVRYDKIPPRYYALEHLAGQHNRNIEPEIPYTKVSGEM